ncbi:WG repeat-containing protein [Pseudochryseolinea flava]|uniref:WG repeat-containing protein n=1 Tax=Pseudochryseolinea flava TaxID=2059302 RepID=A0A364Y4B5_9BACT|nr:WG repeat-containing protein [Pseudochryseolinea flava]RAW00655.1 hypothetical protein DQQ10_13785 [Pseudochryseolinea flava]
MTIPSTIKSLFFFCFCIIITVVHEASAQGNLYPIYEKAGRQHHAFIDVSGKKVISLDTALHLDDFEVFKSKYIFPYKVKGTQRTYFAVNKKGKVVHEFPSDITPLRMTDNLIVIMKKGEFQLPEYGLMNESFKIVLQPTYYAIYDFSEGLAAVERSGIGFINAQGKEVIKCGTSYMGAKLSTPKFKEGLARFMTHDGKMGFMDKTGAVVIQATFHSVNDFQDGIARACLAEEDGSCGYINKKGEWVLQPEGGKMENEKFVVNRQGSVFIGGYSDNLIAKRTYEKGRAVGYVNLQNQWLIPATYWHAEEFKNGYALVVSMDGKDAIIDKNNTVMAVGIFQHMKAFDNDVILVTTARGTYLDNLNTNTFAYYDRSFKLIWKAEK